MGGPTQQQGGCTSYTSLLKPCQSVKIQDTPKLPSKLHHTIHQQGNNNKKSYPRNIACSSKYCPTITPPKNIKWTLASYNNIAWDIH
eukprot:11989546-Ditylum_brightwellii.AAC.1